MFSRVLNLNFSGFCIWFSILGQTLSGDCSYTLVDSTGRVAGELGPASNLRMSLSKVLRSAKPATLFNYILPQLPLLRPSWYSLPPSHLITCCMLHNPLNPSLNTLLRNVFLPATLLGSNSLCPTLWSSLFGSFCNVARRHAGETPPQRLRSAGGSSDAIGQHTHKSRCR